MANCICRTKARNLVNHGAKMAVDSFMIKPIVYHNIEEKAELERELMAAVPNEKRASASKALMNIFSSQGKKTSTTKSKNKL